MLHQRQGFAVEQPGKEITNGFAHDLSGADARPVLNGFTLPLGMQISLGFEAAEKGLNRFVLDLAIGRHGFENLANGRTTEGPNDAGDLQFRLGQGGALCHHRVVSSRSTGGYLSDNLVQMYAIVAYICKMSREFNSPEDPVRPDRNEKKTGFPVALP